MVFAEIAAALALVKGIETILKDLKAVVRSCRCEEGNPAGPQKRPKREDGNHGKSRRKREKEREEIEYKRKDENHGKSQRKREKEREEIEYKRKDGNHGKSQRKGEKEKEEIEYKAWLRENITKCTDSWTTYKTDSERATNSKLDLAEKERLFRKHVDELREQYRRDYRQLLKEVITPDLASKYLTSWSDAKNRMLQRQRFLNLPEKERKTEWGKHAERILKQRQIEKEREVTEYKAWLSKNITKWTDSWRRYSERCTNSKLDREEKKILFEKHVKGLHEQFLKDYRQLLKEVITHQRATQNIKCLKSWSNAEHLLRGHQRFGRLPKEDREPEWRIHANQILKKMNKQ